MFTILGYYIMSLSRNFTVSCVESPDLPYSIILERKGALDCLLFSNNTITEITKDESDALRFSNSNEKLCDAYACLGVFCPQENDNWLVLVTGFSLVGKFRLADIYKITAVSIISLNERNRYEPDYLNEVKKFLSSGHFYFCPSSVTGYDITRSMQRQKLSQSTYTSPFLDPMSRSFFWNRSFWLPFMLAGVSSLAEWLCRTICGGIEIRTLYVETNTVRSLIISRLSCERVGTRFSCRGCDDDGHVANFVETEQLLVKEDEDELSSFVQIRGSVPLLWEQTGHNLGKHFVRLSRGYEACAPAFERHFTRLFQQYKEVSVVNLLHAAEKKSNRLICEGSEPALNIWYQEHHKSSSILQNTDHVAFDFHAEWKRTQEKCLVKLWERLASALTRFGFFHYADGLIRSEQAGVIRTNCIDCLDRTNCVQSMLGIQVLNWQLAALKLNERSRSYRTFVDALKQMWQQNGDHCSRIYAGTGVMLGGKAKYMDVATSASRAVQGSLLDSSKNSAMRLILKSSCPTGELGDRSFSYIQDFTPFFPIWLCRELVLRYPQYTTTHPLRIFVGTWNVNGGQRTRSVAYKNDSIDDWLNDFVEATHRDRPELLDPGKDYSQPVDIYAIGFQEIVDLNASNIMSADTRNQEDWAERLIKTISRSPERQYIYLTSIQLVGVCLFVFIRPQLAPHLRDLSVCSVKTGLGGATGNKGGVAVRFRLDSSTLCFVCGHLAAGQNKVSDRNSDLAEIANKLSFPDGRTVWSHDYIYLFGDFNYRIGQLGNQMVRDLVAAKQYRELANYEQLRLEVIKAHEALEKFKEETGGDADQLPTWQRVLSTFNEGIIDFAPTYKYDIYSDDYDTSEKNRVPAWTDRILWTRRPLFVDETLADGQQAFWNCGRILLYNRAELRTSDHRPVYAVFEVDLFKVDDKKMKSTVADFLNSVGPLDGTIVVTPVSDAPTNSDDIRMVVASCGNISAMRYVNSQGIVTFSDPRDAADALKLGTNTMFAIEPKFLNHRWLEAIFRILLTNSDDYSTMKTNKLLAEPVQVANLLGGRDSPFPTEEPAVEEEDSNEPNYEQEFNHFLSITDNRMHQSKSADNLRSAKTPPPPRPPPPSAKKLQGEQSPAPAFIVSVPISQPPVVEVPLLCKGCAFFPKTSKFLKLTSVGAVHTHAVLDDSFFENGKEDQDSGVKESKSVDELLEIAENPAEQLSSDSPPIVPKQPPNRPPPPAPVRVPDTVPTFSVSNSDSVTESLDSASLTSWPNDMPPPTRAPPPLPLSDSDPWNSPVLNQAPSTKITGWPDDPPLHRAPPPIPDNDPHVPHRAPPPPPEIGSSDPWSLPASNQWSSSENSGWPDDHPPHRAPPPVPTDDPRMPHGAPPPLPEPGSKNPWSSSTPNQLPSSESSGWPDDPPTHQAPPPARRVQPVVDSNGSSGHNFSAPPPPRRAVLPAENAPRPPPRAPPRSFPNAGAPPPPPPRRV